MLLADGKVVIFPGFESSAEQLLKLHAQGARGRPLKIQRKALLAVAAEWDKIINRNMKLQNWACCTKGMIMKAKMATGIFLAAAVMVLMAGCVSTIESKADGGDVKSMKKMARLYNGERVFVYDPADELPIIGLFTEAVVGKPTKDEAKSLAWMKKAAEKGDIVSMFTVGQYYGEGFGTEKSFKDSADWFDKTLKAAKADNSQQISFAELCKALASWFDNNLTESNVETYHGVLLQMMQYINPEAVCYKIIHAPLEFNEKVKLMDLFSKDFKYSESFAPVVKSEISEKYMKTVFANSKHRKLFDLFSGMPVNLLFCGDYNVAVQIEKEKTAPHKFSKKSFFGKDKDSLQMVTDRGTFFGTRHGNYYFMADIPDSDLSKLYEYTRPRTSDERMESLIFGGFLAQAAIVPVVVYSDDFDENKFLYPEMYLFGGRKKISGVKIDDVVEKLKADYKDIKVKNLSSEKVSRVIIGTPYRVTYKPVGYQLENNEVFLNVKSAKDVGLREPKVEKIKPGDPDYQFAFINAKIHCGFNYSKLKGYPQRVIDEKHKEEDEKFEEFFNRNLDADTLEEQLAKYGTVISIKYQSSDAQKQAWHNVMESKKNYRLASPGAAGNGTVVDTAISAVLSNLVQMQAQLTGKKQEEIVVIVECFDKALYDKATAQYPKIKKALAERAEMKKQKDYEDKKKEQLNF